MTEAMSAQSMKSQQCEKEVLSDRMLLRKASGGLALRGILKTKNIDDQLEEKELLLEVPENVKITDMSEYESKVEHFSSIHEEEDYKKRVDILGCSATSFLSVPFKMSVPVGTAVCNTSEDEFLLQKNIVKNYYSTVKYYIKQVASCNIESRDMKLSQAAQGELKEILIMLETHGPENEKIVQDACKRFLRVYGSHVYKGKFSFGGKFWWTCFTSGFSRDETGAIKEMQNKAISASAGCEFACFGGFGEASIENVKETYQGKCSTNALTSTRLQTRLTGGPPEANNFSEWIHGLVSSKSTWVLTDRGTVTVPIWTIIAENHDKELGKIVSVLKSTWEKMTGLKSEQEVQPRMLSYKFEDVLNFVNEWNKEKDLPLKAIDAHLSYLCKVKNDILRRTGNHNIWVKTYLSEPILQTFLVTIIESQTEPQVLGHVKFQMQQLIEQDDFHDLTLETFPQIDKVLNFLFKTEKFTEITDLEKFSRFLKKAVQDVTLDQLQHENPLLDPKLPSEVIEDVARNIRSLRHHYRHTYDDVFIAIVVEPFQQSRGVALNELTIGDLQKMSELFSEERMEFNNYVSKSPLQFQAYLFALALKDCEDTGLKPQWVRQLMKELDPPIDQQLDSVLRSSSCMELKHNLQLLLTGKFLGEPPSIEKGSTQLLKNILSEEPLHLESSQPLGNLVSLHENNLDAHSLFQKLGLLEFYPKKLQLRDALCIRLEPLELSLGKSHPTDPKQLPHLILQKILAYDYQCRSDLMHSRQQYCDDAYYGRNDSDNLSYYDSDESSEDSCSNLMLALHECSDSTSPHSVNSHEMAAIDQNLDQDESTSDSDEELYYDCYDTEIHPLDSLLAIIICSDDFLRQDLLSRLAKCQLAIPFIIPDPFTKKLNIPLWAMRSIIKEWKRSGSRSVKQKTYPIVKYKMPIVSFIRFGKNPPQCIAKILNEVLSESSHRHFFHDDCPGGQYHSILRDGLVDMCWYVPAGKPTDEYPYPVTFLNLHGDARQYPRQIKFLNQISSMCFILLTEIVDFNEDILGILKGFSKLLGGITLLNGVGEAPTTLKIKFDNVNMKKNLAEIKNLIRIQITKKHCGHEKKFRSIEECCYIKDKEIFVDEECDPILKRGLNFENKVRSKLTGNKDAMLPLQGLWRDWASQDKEYHRQARRGNKSVVEYATEIKASQKQLRKEQLKYVKSLSPLMELFISSLLKLGGSSNKDTRNYFLQCLKLNLNDISGKVVLEKQHQYHLTRLKLQNAENLKDEALKSKCKQELQAHQQEITDASFGMEHLFRELGQVYEAAKLSSEFGEELSRLPKVAAELLIDGYPLELMDGDVAHVPLVWINDVMAELEKILGDPNVYVLSVLGLQSTGKSTMLNAVFGLQFNVSAGRCTRGAFMHLLPIDEDLRKQTKYSYVLVIDTEGLRAPELNHLIAQKHDNELATFVIGLANTTFINIFGAVPGDMDDILQTSVHAFLRMTELQYKPSCHFIHQNAESSKNNEVGHANFTDKLDEFAVLAAKAEHLEEEPRTFNDVIRFNYQKNVHYFEGLFKGDPLKDPVNHGYSISAQMLKLNFLKSLYKAKSDTQLSSFQKKLQLLWKALLTEKFVFSFKNTREVTAYNTLETKYNDLKWTFCKEMFTWEKKAENQINSTDLSTYPSFMPEKLEELHTLSKKLYDEKKEELNSIFDDEWSEISIQWKGGFEKRLSNLSTELHDNAKGHCNKLEKRKKAFAQIEEQRENYATIISKSLQRIVGGLIEKREKLEKGQFESEHLRQLIKDGLFTTASLQKYKEHKLISEEQLDQISSIIDEPTDDNMETIISVLGKEQAKQIVKKEKTVEELEFMFTQIWDTLMDGLDVVAEHPIAIQFEVEKTLIEYVRAQGNEGKLLAEMNKNQDLVHWGAYLDLTSEERKNALDEQKLDTKPIWLSKIVKKVEKFRSMVARRDKQQRLEDDCTEVVFTNAQQHLKDILAEECDFNSAFVYQLLFKVDKDLMKYSFPAEFKLQIFLIICGHAIPKFEEMSRTFRSQYDPRLYLEKSVKKPLCTHFKNQFFQIEAEEAIASNLCAHLEEPIKVQVERTIVHNVCGQMRHSEQHFSSKKALKVKVLTDLYNDDEFSNYMVYVSDVEHSLLNWLESYTIEYCDRQVNKSTILQVLIKNEVLRLIGVVESEVSMVKGKGDARKCLAALCDNSVLKCEIAVNLKVSDLQTGYESLEGVVFDSLQIKIREELMKLKAKLYEYYKNIKCKDKIEDWRDKFCEFYKDLMGCTAQCPFCKEQCDLTDPTHVDNGRMHTALVHRPACLATYKRRYDDVLVVDICPTNVISSKTFACDDTNREHRNFKDYQSVYPTWSISSDAIAEGSLYWMFFVAKYKNLIAQRLGAKPPEVPRQWEKIKWEEVSESLKRLYLS